MEREPVRTILAAALATLLFVGALRAFVSDIYNSNLNQLGLNATAAIPLALLAPALLRGSSSRWLPGAALALGLARLALPWYPLGVGGIVLAALACIAGLVVLAGLLPDGGAAPLAAGLALGFAADVAIVAWGRSWDWTQTRTGGLLVLPVAVALVALSWRAPAPVPAPAAAPARRGMAPLGLGAILFLETAILANPFGLARWDVVDARLAVPACAGGLLVGAWLALRPLPRAAFWAMNAGALLFALDHGLAHTPLVPLEAIVAQVALVVDLAALLAPLGTFPRAARAFGLGAGAMMLLLFLFLFAFTFAYVPLSAAWHGLERWLPLAAVLLALGAALLARPAARAWTMPRGVVAGALVLALVLAAAPLARPAASVPAPQGPTIRLLSFNLHQGFGNDGVLDPEVFVRILRDAHPDVVVLQEYDGTRVSSGNVDIVRILAERLGYFAVYGPPTSAEGFSGALLSRFPVEETRWFALPTTSDNRYVTESRVNVSGRDAWIEGVHFGLPASDRAAQVEALLAAANARSGPRLLVGDFNSCPAVGCEDDDGGHVYGTLASAGWRDAWVAAGHDANDTAGYTYASFAPDERIDLAWLSPEWRVHDATTIRTPDTLAASDHLPLLVTLELT